MSNLFKLKKDVCILYRQGHVERIQTNVIPKDVRGIVYLCEINKEKTAIEVTQVLLFDTEFWALESYANIPNPASQVVTADSYDKLCKQLQELHEKMESVAWLKGLLQCI